MMPPTLLVHVFRFNSISKITDKSLTGLRKLEILLVHGNDIHSLPDGAFRDLSSLQVGEVHHTNVIRVIPFGAQSQTVCMFYSYLPDESC